ncbi:MAG TPA: hypothetical protein GX523_10680 [Desulfitobacterium dehalogenans]|uniref:DUF6906 domain-containing protein n=1 Tax=Desulfitobacterium dehalogenans TaxID=36854 RepID=A0A7C6Z4V5_9FIRM|nr:hypothetical protein [Desulfitobacterium dehalogenans]
MPNLRSAMYAHTAQRGEMPVKHGKNPTRRQKELIKARRLNPDSWMVTKDTPTEMEIVHRITDSVRVIRK